MRIPLIDKFPVKALLILKRGKGISAQFDKARYITKGDTCYEFKKYKVKTLPCSYQQMIIMNNGKPFGVFFEYERDCIIPLDLNEIDKHEIKTETPVVGDDGTPLYTVGGEPVVTTKTTTVGEMLTVIDPGVAFWGQQRRRKAEDRHKNTSWWANNMPFVAMSMTFVLMIVLSYIFMGAISDTGSSIVNAMNQLNAPPG